MNYSNMLAATAILLAALHMPGCHTDKTAQSPHHEANSVYYWRTTLQLDEAERDFIKEYDVQRAYVRFFDVVPDISPIARDAVIPNATLTVTDSLPINEIVPTVFITVDALRLMAGHEEYWADLIVHRVDNMMVYNDMCPRPLEELQLDCDWTESTDSIFFRLCTAVKSELTILNKSALLSATIRLHQLSQAAPPVDYGVMMLYNTGSFKNPDTGNSILSLDDVKPYMPQLASYPLHLDFAYPTYGWNLLFSGNELRGLLRDDIRPDCDILRQVGDNRYTFTRDTIINGTLIHRGDIMRREESSPATLRQVKRLIEENIGNRPHSNIIYHLDSDNLSKYTCDEIKNLYN